MEKPPINSQKDFYPEKKEISHREQRIRKITHLYYSRPEIQKAIFKFCKNREISPRYFEGFGKRPDSFQYQGDIFELVKKGATSFHCSEEIWSDPLQIKTEMTPELYNEIRTGWDLLLDIDSKYIDYSKIMVQEIIKVLDFHGVKNIGIKFSGSKGFHIIIPWAAFPKEVNDVKTSDMFPEWPRIILNYINEKVKGPVTEKILSLINNEDSDKYKFAKKYIKREGGWLNQLSLKKGLITSILEKLKIDEKSFNTEVIPDLILISPRHLFRTPYSLHEKTALASVVLTPEEIKTFELKDANLMTSDIRDFMPKVKKGEASELLMQALDWHKDQKPDEEKKAEGKYANFKPIQLNNLKETQFPPCVNNLLKGIADGKKRALFILINLCRSIGMDKVEIEKKIEEWNKKNTPPLKQGYILSQLSWAYRKKPIMPPNCKEFYQGIGICQPDEFCKLTKNPVNYVVKKNFLENKKKK